jgi:peptidoglycan/xylan/chitin deacetylase (PgdA/CDA1 family)
VAVPGLVRRLAGTPVADRLVDIVERVLPARRDGLAVLTFHRVAEPGPATVPGILSATPERFGILLDRLVGRSRVVSITDVLERARGGPRLPARSVLLTFDDAYADFDEHAWPALRARGLPAVLFVPTAYPDAPDRAFWWERLFRALATTDRSDVESPAGHFSLATHADRVVAYRRLREALKAMTPDETLRQVDRLVTALQPVAAVPDEDVEGTGRVMGWEALRRLQADGLALAPHSRTHPLLSRITDDSVLDDEVAGSRDDLRRMTGSDLPVFAYPSGATSGPAIAAVRRAGIEIAFSTVRGVNRLDAADWLSMRRINVGAGTPDALIRGQLVAYGVRR